MDKFNSVTAEELGGKIDDAMSELHGYLTKCFPVGSRCEVMLMAGQKNPTPGEIVGVSPNRYGGDVLVKIDTAKSRSRYRTRSIPAHNVSLTGG